MYIYICHDHKSESFYNVVAARRNITAADYERLKSIVPQGAYVVSDADDKWADE